MPSCERKPPDFAPADGDAVAPRDGAAAGPGFPAPRSPPAAPVPAPTTPAPWDAPSPTALSCSSSHSVKASLKIPRVSSRKRCHDASVSASGAPVAGSGWGSGSVGSGSLAPAFATQQPSQQAPDAARLNLGGDLRDERFSRHQMIEHVGQQPVTDLLRLEPFGR